MSGASEGAQPAKRRQMLGRAVAEIMLPAIAGMFRGKPGHETVARDLGDDRRRRDRQ